MASVDDTAALSSVVDTPEFSVHKVGANLIFDDYGLDPYWGFVSAFEPELEDYADPFDAVGETWDVVGSSFWNGQIADPQGRYDDGLYEYRVNVQAQDDVGDRDASIAFRPGYPDATHVETGDIIGGMPNDIPESIRVSVQSVNIHFDDLLELLQALGDAIGWNQKYITEPHEWSSIFAFEGYTRIDRETAEALVTGHNGVLQQMARFGSSEGARGVYKWNHEETIGHYEAVALDPETWQMLIPDQQYAKRSKCYHPAHPRAEADPDDPLSHPKFEVQYWQDYSDDSVPWDQRHDLLEEVTQAGANVLSWAGVDLEPGSDVYISDAYHDADAEAEYDVDVYGNPLDELEAAVERQASDELLGPEVTPGEMDVLEVVTDGGPGHYHQIAAEAGRSSSTVYRAVQRLGILETDGGTVQFPDIATREAVEGVIERLRDAVDWAGNALRDVVDAANPMSRRDEEPSALERWMNRHGVRLVDKHADPTPGQVDSDTQLHFEVSGRWSATTLRSVIRDGLEAAECSSLLTKKFRDAYITWTDLEGRSHTFYRVNSMAEKALRSI